MTLDEAIKHCEEKAKELREQPFKEKMDIEEVADCEECAEEHEQLAKWLKELKAYKEASKGDLISREALKEAIETYDKFACLPDGKLYPFRDLKHPEMFIAYIHIEDVIKAIDNAPTVEIPTELCKDCRFLKDCETCEEKLRPQGECEKCDYRKFTETFIDGIVDVISKNGIADFDEFAKRCGDSYLHQESITKSDTQI